MKNWLPIVVGIIIISLYSYFVFVGTPKKEIRDYKNISYKIEGKDITLNNGVSEIEIAPGSASKLVTKYFGNEAKGDLNGDGIEDIAFILTQDGGGSGTFFYGVVAIQDKDGNYTGTDATFLGDRIAPQPTDIKDGLVIFNYAERSVGKSMVVQASVGVSKYLKVEGNSLIPFDKSSGMIKVLTPSPNSLIKSPLKISGEAKGNYFFEASFPVILLDSNNQEITHGIAKAMGDWMTTEFVPFELTLTFNTPKTKTGTLVFKKDNPSGLSENDASFSMPINF